jgi:phage baseplate assembly protein W
MGIYGKGYTGTESPISRTTDAKERTYIYSDVDFIFGPSPLYRMQGLSGDVVRKFDIEAIKQSVKNIILTNNYERPWKPDMGANLRNTLFENFEDPWAMFELKEKIEEQLIKYEPRVTLNDVLIEFDEDYLELNIEITFTINAIKNGEQVSVRIQMERVR